MSEIYLAPPETVGGGVLVPGRIVHYQTDGRNGMSYVLPAIVTCTASSHPGDYPDGSLNPLPAPDMETGGAHLTVLTPGGFGTTVETPDVEPRPPITYRGNAPDEAFKVANKMIPGSGSYVEWNVPYSKEPKPRTWRWPSDAQ